MRALRDYMAAGKLPRGLSGLAAEARKAGSFEAFRQDFLVQLKHGTYWHWTHRADFRIDPATGPRDMMSLGEVSAGALMVTSDLAAWEGYGTGGGRPYVAMIDLSEVPREAYYQTGRNAPNEFFVAAPANARVVAVMTPRQAKAVERRLRALLPGSPDELREFYDIAAGAPARRLDTGREGGHDMGEKFTFQRQPYGPKHHEERVFLEDGTEIGHVVKTASGWSAYHKDDGAEVEQPPARTKQEAAVLLNEEYKNRNAFGLGMR